MTAFFIPAADTSEQAEEVLTAIKKFATENLSREIGSRRVYRLSYNHNGQTVDAVVGEADPLSGEPVIAILDAGDMYLVTTANRGVARGEPILVGKGSVLYVEDFDDA